MITRSTLESLAAACAKVALGAALVGSAQAQNAVFRKVAESNEVAPGAGGALFGTGFSAFSAPVINNAGQTAFRAQLFPPGPIGIWSEGSGVLDLVALTGSTPAPGTGGATFINFLTVPPIFNDVGDVAFAASLTGTGGTLDDTGLWRQSAGVLELVAREDDPAPGATGAVFEQISSVTEPTFNAFGHVAFKGFVRGAGVTSANNIGSWSTSTGILALVARQGDPAPGFGGDYQFLFLPPTLNGLGAHTFSGSVTGPGLQNGIWKGTAGSLVVVARSGDTAPGTGGSTFTNFFHARYTPMLNDAGQVAFIGALSADAGAATTGIWSDGTGTLTKIARRGDPAPGTAVVFAAFDQNFPNLVINGAGHVAFRAALEGAPAASDSGIWAQDASGLHLIAREGAAAPGTGGEVFGDMHPQFFRSMAFNAAGQVAFKAFLAFSPGVDFNNDEGIWMTNAAGDLELVVREGDAIEIAPGDLRTVGSLGEIQHASGGQDGRARSLNDSGELAIVIGLGTGNTILVASLPTCPPPAAYCTAAANSVSPNGATIQTSGSQVVSANDFTLESGDLPPNQPGLFFFGPDQADVPFGNGIRCVGGSVIRLPVVQSDANGFASHTLDFTSSLLSAQIVPGANWNFQYWYRDPAAGGAAFNLSDAIEVTFCN